MLFLNIYEHFSNRFIFQHSFSCFRAKLKMDGYGMLDLATAALACFGLFAPCPS
jgi:hypothetical protein